MSGQGQQQGSFRHVTAGQIPTQDWTNFHQQSSQQQGSSSSPRNISIESYQGTALRSGYTPVLVVPLSKGADVSEIKAEFNRALDETLREMR